MSNKIRWRYDITYTIGEETSANGLEMNEKNRRCESERTHPSTSESRRALKFEDLPGFNIKIGGYQVPTWLRPRAAHTCSLGERGIPSSWLTPNEGTAGFLLTYTTPA